MSRIIELYSRYNTINSIMYNNPKMREKNIELQIKVLLKYILS